MSRDNKNRNYPQDIVYEIIPEIKDAAERNDVLVIEEIGGDEDDMDLAETHIFRPLFRYRAQLERRERLRKSQTQKQ